MISKILLSTAGIILVFIASSSFIFMYQFFNDISLSKNEEENNYKIDIVYCHLILYSSFAWILEIIIMIVFIIWFFYKNICKLDHFNV